MVFRQCAIYRFREDQTEVSDQQAHDLEATFDNVYRKYVVLIFDSVMYLLSSHQHANSFRSSFPSIFSVFSQAMD